MYTQVLVHEVFHSGSTLCLDMYSVLWVLGVLKQVAEQWGQGGGLLWLQIWLKW